MFGFSRAVEYALIALINVAKKGRGAPVSVASIADAEGLPRDYLSKIMPTLLHQGIVRSVRGIGGGFILAQDPSEISVLEVVRSVDGAVEVAKCLGTEECCALHHRCGLVPLVSIVQIELSKVLERITLADAMKWGEQRVGVSSGGWRG
ncbi:MAG: hypothetical protein CME06_12800 [Gemmatimonadetes bacterium]|nr:hypothetical protein [Gemmatimonadota bacterium]